VNDSVSTAVTPKARDVVEKCGGYSSVAKLLGLNRQSVFNRRGVVTAKYVRTIAVHFDLDPSWIRPDLYG